MKKPPWPDPGGFYVETNTEGGRNVYTSELEAHDGEARERERLDRLIREGSSEDILAELKAGTIYERSIESYGRLEEAVLAMADKALGNSRSGVPTRKQLVGLVGELLEQNVIERRSRRKRGVRGVAPALRKVLRPAAGPGARPGYCRVLVRACLEALKRERPKGGWPDGETSQPDGMAPRQKLAEKLGVSETFVRRLLAPLAPQRKP